MSRLLVKLDENLSRSHVELETLRGCLVVGDQYFTRIRRPT
ncbi:MAG TPA: hypothetical protein VLQ45_26825 [Thermoanaerobaculia bacterium]|nr:hypothetical protein [Thermoanaerobaculia bacterium]